MKLTWFGGKTIRIYVAGAILVGEPEGAPQCIDAAELVSGADAVFRAATSVVVDPLMWKPRKAPTALTDDGTIAEVLVWQISQDVLLIDAVGEPPLLLAAGALPGLGRWARDAVVVLFGDGEGLTARGSALLAATTPRLLVLAGSDAAMEIAISALRARLDGTGLIALEPGMALEV